MEIGGRRALLTGASGGIGEAIAQALHSRGANLILSGRRTAVLEELAGKLGDRVEIVPADLSAPEGWETLAGEAGAVDILVANAAVPGSGRLDDFSIEEIDRTIDVNLRAPMQLARQLTPAMVERGGGHLVFISSMSGKIAAGGGSVYSATKFGLRGFAASLRDELHGSGVGVSLVSPGFVREAGMFADTDVKLPAYVRTVSPQQVADAVIRGIERDKGDIDVAPLTIRASAWLAAIAPDAVASTGRRLGSTEMADELADRQRPKR
jgi:short-subunit dehydrogenase